MKKINLKLFVFVITVFFNTIAFSQGSDDFSLDDTVVDGANTSDMSTTSSQKNSSNEELSQADLQNIEPAENVNLASPVEILQNESALYGFSAGISMGMMPLYQSYDLETRLGSITGSISSVEKIEQQSNPYQYLGVILRYAVTPFYSLGTDLNLTIGKSINHESVGIQKKVSTGEISFWRAEVNFSYALKVAKLPIYFLAGVGAERIYGSQIEQVINGNGAGYQLGGGLSLASKINLEALYSCYFHRISNDVVAGENANIPPKTIDTTKAQMTNKGLVVRTTYSFD